VIVHALFLYPVKSCAGIAVDDARVEADGLRFDRRWMVVDSRGEFLTQREHPRMALIRPEIREDTLHLSAAGTGDLVLPLDPTEGGEGIATRVWGDPVDARDGGDTAARWISSALGWPSRLVGFPARAVRPTDPAYARGHRVAFQDGFPTLALTVESMDELNRRLPSPLSIRRFRPNLVVSRASPHAEDRWRRIRVGEVEMEAVKPCARCTVTTVDPESGLRGKEPLRTLAGYRSCGGKVFFGQNLVHLSSGRIRVGDPVTILEEGPPRPGPTLAEDLELKGGRMDGATGPR